MKQWSLFSILCFVLISFGIASVSAQTCMDNDGHFRPNGTYDTNRRLILSSLPSNVTTQEGLFFNGSIGQEPNRVYAIGMCIPGSTPQDCSDCLVVRMIDAASTAKSTPSSSNNHYKADMALLTALENIYALMQCTPDLSSGDCDNCLRQSARDYQSCCGQKQGGAFDNITVASSPPPLPPMASPSPGDDQARRTNNEDSKGISPGVVAAITVPTVIILLVLGVVLCRRRMSMQRTDVESDSDISTAQSSQYDLKTIEAATNKFLMSNKLGEGGFGEVYKGTLSNGTEVAVKRLSKKSGQGIREFKNEAVLVSKLQHRNLVRLLGFCLEGDEKILIYEFVPNKSLNHFLFDPKKQSQLNWTKRYKIIGGIARGILYLHQDSQLTIIHRDLKASNILLDANMNPKISDFGLSTIFGMEQTRGNTSRIAGTYGYMSPEYAMHGQYSMKSDIYSFGVLVLEIISGKKNSRAYQMDETSTPGNLVTYAWRLWRNGSPLELVDPAIGRNYQSNEVTRCIHIALLCVQENPEDRPMLSTIILMLTSNTITLPVPRLPSFIPRSRDELDQISEGLESSQSTGRSVARRESYENARAFVGIWLELQQIRFQSEGGFRRAQRCMNRKGNFMPNGTYDVNRRLILSSLPSNVTSKEGLFFNGSIGQEPNRVYAVGMCIPGSTSDDCSVCIKLASDRLIKNCTNQTNAFAWPADPTLCHVRYSNTSFLGSADLKPRVLLPKEGDIISNLTEFTKTWEDLVVRMIDAASAAKSTPSSSNNHYRADVAPLTVLQNIYALMQCTPDLSSGDCDTCLRQSARAYQSCCGQKQGGVVTRPSCFFRWDLYAFSKAFDNITVASLPPPRLPPVASPPPAYDHARTTDNNSKGISSGVVAAITVPTVVTVFILLVLGFVLCRRRESMQRTEVESDSDISTPQSSQYDFKTVEAATNKFSRHNKLGEGGFGEVYKGTLSNGTEVAVKRLSEKSGQGIREFKNEAVLVSKLQHRNLVKLLGFCLEGEEKILIYEFVPNKSLDYFLFDPEEQDQLHWTQRYKIIGGIARGILYLHQDSQLTVIHRDLKASNILLDANMNPKISDFGLSTIFGMEQTRGNTSRIAGTYGYMSPEYAMQGQYSMKSDIYSFGVLVLEIISGKKNGGVYQMDETSTPGNLVTYAWRLWKNGSPLEMVDLAIGRNYEINEVTRCIHIALLCVQDNPEDRPMLSTIILMLTSNTITLPVPRLPSFIPRSRHELDQVSEGLESSRSTGRYVGHSVNDVSITDLEAR
ncbi:BnaC01g14390D [Brassica napus]|uniref:BnaC01g14390D protein n=1 Tax=Brassica napus TaxID=3708 RepID=A0A078FD17_BRANA|nr:BnaC01g14390D [Brassica napus]